MSSFYKVDDNLKNTLCQFKNALNISFEEFFDTILPMILCPNVIEKNENELKALKEITSQNANVEAYIKATDVCLNFNCEEQLSNINVPTLILAGKCDDISTLDMQKNLHSKIKNSKLVVIEDVKHNLLIGENNEKILTDLEEFF